MAERTGNVKSAFLNELEEALANGPAERRTKTLRRVTDLFVFGSSHFSDDHITLFDGVFGHLIADIELSARETLAQRLASLPNAPPKVIRTLAFDDAIGVAGPVLSRSGLLDNATLVENARTKSQDHLLAISQRKALAETITDVLVERGDRNVALTVVQNPGAKFSETGYVRLVKRSEGDDEMARSVGARPEIPRQHFLKLLTTASKAVRIALEATDPNKAKEIRSAVADVAAAIQVEAAAASRNYAAAQAVVEGLRAAGKLTEAEVEAFAHAGKFEETAVGLALLTGLPIDVIERAMVQDREGVLIVAKASGLSWSTVKAVLLLCADKGGLSPQHLEQCRMLFHKLKRETAQQVIAFQQKRQAGQSFID